MSETDRVLGEIKQSLDELSAEISSGKYAAEFLTDLKRSVDQLRLTLWAVIETAEQNKRADKKGLVSLKGKLVEFRVKRIVQMLNDLRSDLMIPHPSELEELRAAFRTAMESFARRAGQV